MKRTIELTGVEKVTLNLQPIISDELHVSGTALLNDLKPALKATNLADLDSGLNESARRLQQRNFLDSAYLTVVPDGADGKQQAVKVFANPLKSWFGVKAALESSTTTSLQTGGEGSIQFKLNNVDRRGASVSFSTAQSLMNQRSMQVNLSHPRLLERDVSLDVNMSISHSDLTQAASYIEGNEELSATFVPVYFDQVRRPQHQYSVSVSRSVQRPSCRPIESGLCPAPSEASVHPWGIFVWIFSLIRPLFFPNSIVDQAGESSKITLSHRYSDDHRDSRSLPTRGHYVEATTVGY